MSDKRNAGHKLHWTEALWLMVAINGGLYAGILVAMTERIEHFEFQWFMAVSAQTAAVLAFPYYAWFRRLRGQMLQANVFGVGFVVLLYGVIFGLLNNFVLALQAYLDRQDGFLTAGEYRSLFWPAAGRSVTYLALVVVVGYN